jgi:NTP pyrophosphatase (non-canonical NTP hydrolase)
MKEVVLRARIVKRGFEDAYLIFLENNSHTCEIYEVQELENTLESFVDLIWGWARERGLDSVSPYAQALKTVEEAEELRDALQGWGSGKVDLKEVADAIGDVFVTLVIVSRLCNLDLLECVKLAYNEIKDKEGRDGVSR